MNIDLLSGQVRVIGIGKMDGLYVSNWKFGQNEIELWVAQKIQETLLRDSSSIWHKTKLRSFSFANAYALESDKAIKIDDVSPTTVVV